MNHLRRAGTQRIFGALIIVVLFFGQYVVPVEAAPTAALSWKYVALGDSLAVGRFAWFGYVPRYASYLRTDTGASVSTTNLGRDGWTSAQLLNAIRNDATFRTAISGANILTWDIGGNDLADARTSYKWWSCGGADNQDCLRKAETDFYTNWNAILEELLKLRNPSSTIMRTMDIYNPYVRADKNANTWPNDSGNDFVVFKPYVDRINAHIRSSVAGKGILCAEVYFAFNGTSGTEDPVSKRLIAFDGMHPNDSGHKLIADKLRALRYTPLK